MTARNKLLLFVGMLGMLAGMAAPVAADPLMLMPDDPVPPSERTGTAGSAFSPNDKLNKKPMNLAPEWVASVADRELNFLSDDALSQADQFVAEARWEEACSAIETALQRDPDNQLIMGKAAVIYALAGQFDQASVWFRTYLQHDPDNVPYIVGWGGVLIRLNMLKPAEKVLQRALYLAPEDVSAHFQQTLLNVMNGTATPWDGWSQLSLQDLLTVIGWLRFEQDELVTLLQPAGFQEACRIMLGVNAETLVEVEAELQPLVAGYQLSAIEREARYTRLQEVGVTNVWVALGRIKALFDQGLVPEALEGIKGIQNSYPTNYSVYFNGGLLALNAEQYPDAEAAFLNALQLEEQPDALFGLACAYAGQGKFEATWIILRRLKQENPRHLKVLLEGSAPYLMNIKRHPDYK